MNLSKGRKSDKKQEDIDSQVHARLVDIIGIQIDDQNFEKLFFGLLVVQAILNQPRIFMEKLIEKLLHQLSPFYDKAKKEEM